MMTQEGDIMFCRVKVLQVGYTHWLDEHRLRADGSITLVQGEKQVMVDTGLPQSKVVIIEALRQEGLEPGAIDVVVSTHAHSDHIGNLGLFPQALHLLGNEVFQGDEYILEHPLLQGKPYLLAPGIQVVSTPGHTANDVSVLVTTDQGIVAVVGDLFESEDDLAQETLWRTFSEQPDVQQVSRNKILRVADWIVPGHGKIFLVRRTDP